MKNQKKDKDKLRYDLIPYHALDKVAAVMTIGAAKYEPNNWFKDSKEADICRYEAALGRHYSAHMQGELIDPESGLEHTYHMATNIMFMDWYDKNLKYREGDSPGQTYTEELHNGSK